MPVGVTTVSPTTRASKRPYPADAWPLDRVAEAADGRVLERLGEVAQRDAVLGQRGLGLGAAESGTEDGGHRDRVDGDLGQPAEVEADDAGVPISAGSETAGDARAAAERDDSRVVLHRERQHGRDLVVAAGLDDGVRRVCQVAGSGA